MSSTTYYSSSDSELSGEYLAPQLQGQTLAENFIVADEAKEGGMGRVFFCQDKRDKKFYALKTFRETNSAYESILKEEALFALSLDPHPHIVYTRTVAQENGRYYIVMELMASQPQDINQPVAGQTLAVRLNQGELPLKLTLKWAIQFCRGMEYLNQKGMKAHKDIKPSNLFITPAGDLKIGDFGLTGRSKGGTKGYLPPEMFEENGELDVQSDIYSFGLVLYQMLNGGKSRTEQTVFLPDNQTFDWVEESALEKSPLRDILKKCLAHNKADRYPNFTALRNALENAYLPEYLPVLPMRERTTNEFFYQGMGFYKLQDYTNALTCYGKALERNPSMAEAYSNCGIIRANLMDYSKALEDYTRAIEIDPEYVSAYYNRGIIYQQLKQYDAALKDYTQAIKRDPAHIKSYYNRGLVWHALYQYNNAVEDYIRAKDLAQTDPAYKTLAQKAQQAISEAVQDNRLSKYLLDKKTISIDSVDASYFYKQGQLQAKQGNLEEALNFFQKAIALDNHNAACHAGRANILVQQGKFNAALEDLNQALKDDPQNAIYLASRGQIYSLLKKEREALEDYVQADANGLPNEEWKNFIAAEDPDLSHFLDLMHWIYNKPPQYGKMLAKIKAIQKNERAVVEIYNGLISRFPAEGALYAARANAQRLLQHYTEALADYNKVLELNPNDMASYIGRGNIYAILQNYSAALADYDKALASDSYKNFAYIQRAKVKSLQGDHPAAAYEARRALDRLPNELSFRMVYAREQELLQDYRQAISLYSELIGDAPKKADYYFFRARARFQLNQANDIEKDLDKEIRADLEQAVKLNGEQSEYYALSGLQAEKENCLEEAVQLYTKAIQLDNRCARYYLNRARVVWHSSVADALIDCNRAIELEPDGAEYYALRSFAKKQLGDEKGALADEERAKELDPLTEIGIGRIQIYDKLENYGFVLVDETMDFQPEPKNRVRVGDSQEEKGSVSAQQSANPYEKLITEPQCREYRDKAALQEILEDWDGAVNTYTEMLAVVNNSPSYFNKVLLDRIRIRKKLKDWKGILQDYDLLIERSAQEVEWYVQRAKTKEELQDWQGALADYRQVQLWRPQAAEYVYWSGVIKEKLGYVYSAQEDYQVAVALQPGDPFYQELADKKITPEKASDKRDNKKDVKKEEVSRGLARAKNKMEVGDFTGALEEYSNAIACDPQEGELYFNRAAVKEKQGDFAGARTDYYLAIDKVPDPTLCYERCALLEEKMDLFAAACDSYKKAIDKTWSVTKQAEYYDRCGQLEEKMGNYQAAMKNYVQAREKKPDVAAYYEQIAQLEERGVPVFDSMTSEQKNKVPSLLPSAFINALNTRSSMKNYQKAVELEPTNARYRANLARVKQKDGILEAALGDYRKAVQADRFCAAYYAHMAYINEKLGHYAEALLDWIKALALEPYVTEYARGRARAAKILWKKRQHL